MTLTVLTAFGSCAEITAIGAVATIVAVKATCFFITPPCLVHRPAGRLPDRFTSTGSRSCGKPFSSDLNMSSPFIRWLQSRRMRATGPNSTAQNAVQPCSHFVPSALVAGHKQFANLHLDPLHALLGRASPQVPATSIGKVARSQCVTNCREGAVSAQNLPAGANPYRLVPSHHHKPRGQPCCCFNALVVDDGDRWTGVTVNTFAASHNHGVADLF